MGLIITLILAMIVGSAMPKRFRCNFEDKLNFMLETKWNTNHLTYYIFPKIRNLKHRNAIRNAFKLWAEPSLLKFTETSRKGRADIWIKYKYLPKGVLGRASFPPDGLIEMDTDQEWSTGRPIKTDLMTIVTHEIGHAIGIGHSGARGSVMSAYYTYGTKQHSLGADDKAAIRKLYGGKRNKSPSDSECRQIRGAVINLDENVNRFDGKPVSACCELCENEPGCYGYNWTPEGGGTCHLKPDGQISYDPAWSNWITGYLQEPESASGCHQIYGAVINLDENIDRYDGKHVEECCELCENDPNCYGYNWSPDGGGTCHLKPEGEISYNRMWSDWITGYRLDW